MLYIRVMFIDYPDYEYDISDALDALTYTNSLSTDLGSRYIELYQRLSLVYEGITERSQIKSSSSISASSPIWDSKG